MFGCSLVSRISAVPRSGRLSGVGRSSVGLSVVSSMRYTSRRNFSSELDHKKEKENQKLKEQKELQAKSDNDLLDLIRGRSLQPHTLETKLGDYTRAVKLRRIIVAEQDKRASQGLDELPVDHFDYGSVVGSCCENVVGYIQIPVGTAGPLLLDGVEYTVPLATTEGALVGSTNRGCKAISTSGGATSVITNNGMTRAPLLQLPSIKRALELKEWIEKMDNFYQVAAAFNSTSRFARLSSIKTIVAGRNVYMRFKSKTGDAMGMNMISKGVEKAIKVLHDYFPDMDALSLSGNTCTDKKPSAINWTEGRGKSVICEAIIKQEVISSVLKTRVPDLVNLNIKKNLIGSAMAGSIGGFNAHASNIVTAIFLATGQDPAQNVESSNCITLMEETPEGDLYMTVTMPSIEVGTIGGGTHLRAQSACLKMLGLKEDNKLPGQNSEQLARVVAATVLAGELSLMSALSAGHLVGSHLSLNRKEQKADDGDLGHSLAGLETKQTKFHAP